MPSDLNNKSAFILGVIAAFALGATVTKTLDPGKAAAQIPLPAPEYEFLVERPLSFASPDQLEAKLNRFGNRGFEPLNPVVKYGATPDSKVVLYTQSAGGDRQLLILRHVKRH